MPAVCEAPTTAPVTPVNPLERLSDEIVFCDTLRGEMSAEEVDALVADLRSELEAAAGDAQAAQEQIEMARNRGRAADIISGIGLVEQEAEPRAKKAGKGKYSPSELKKARAARKRNRAARTAGAVVRKSVEDGAETEEASSGGWGTFQAGNLTLNPEEFVRPDGRHRLHLVGNSKKRSEELDSDPRISYELRDDGQKAVFLGMYVPPDMRGQGLGKDLFNYFLRGLEEKGIAFDGTNRIHKPAIALLMKELGLVPEHSDILAAMLPREPGSDPLVPNIVFVKDSGQRRRDVITGSAQHTFYTRADKVPAGFQVDPNKVVALHTRYKLPTAS